MISLAVVTFLAYLSFIFFAESLNPLVKPTLHAHRPLWRYGRRMALAVFTGGICTLMLHDIALVRLVDAVAIGTVIAVLIGLCFSAKKIGNLLR